MNYLAFSIMLFLVQYIVAAKIKLSGSINICRLIMTIKNCYIGNAVGGGGGVVTERTIYLKKKLTAYSSRRQVV